MKINQLITKILVVSILVFAVTSCESDDSVTLPKGVYDNGILVSGEAGSIYYVSNDSLKVKSEKSSYLIKKDLGQYLQSMAFDKNNAYIMVDNQNTVTVVDRYTFNEVALIKTDIIGPRYMTVVGNVGYVTCWGDANLMTDDYIAVVDLTSYTVISTIPVSGGVERIIEKNGKLYVSHKGGYGTNNIVTVYDIATTTKTEITVKDNPDELFFDNSGNLVVLSGGVEWGVETIAAISKINISTNTVISEIVFAAGVHPTTLINSSTNLYYNVGSKVYEMSQTATTLPTAELVDTSAGYLYEIAVENDNLYILDANFTKESTMSIYSLSTKLKTISVAAPIGASKIYFN